MAPFLFSLSRCGVLSRAAKHAGIDRVTAWRAKGTDQMFSDLYDIAIEDSMDALEGQAWDFALGMERADGERDEPMDPKTALAAIKWLLEAHRPQVYKRKPEVNINTAPIYVIRVGDYPERRIASLDDLDNMTSDELRLLAEGEIVIEQSEDAA